MKDLLLVILTAICVALSITLFQHVEEVTDQEQHRMNCFSDGGIYTTVENANEILAGICDHPGPLIINPSYDG